MLVTNQAVIRTVLTTHAHGRSKVVECSDSWSGAMAKERVRATLRASMDVRWMVSRETR